MLKQTQNETNAQYDSSPFHHYKQNIENLSGKQYIGLYNLKATFIFNISSLFCNSICCSYLMFMLSKRAMTNFAV